MKYGYYSDKEIPKSIADKEEYRKQYTTLNSYGYRCPEFSPLPNGRKNVVVLGCSHTFGEGVDDDEVWVSQVEKLIVNNHNGQKKLRFWNLAQPGASSDLCVRILYGSENVLFPKIIIMCWPQWSRRERLDYIPMSLTSADPLLKTENQTTDRNNFLKCFFQIEKFAEYNQAKTFHCFAQDIYNLTAVNNSNVLNETSIKLCWPEWDKHRLIGSKRELITEPDIAKDGVHYGPKHHTVFANKFFTKFKNKLK